jgi:murein DD-endopeptidase MepM/ murein hydrolase activator NlpD
VNRTHLILAEVGLICFSSVCFLCGAAEPRAADDYQLLLQRHLSLPLANLARPDIHDTFNEGRAGGKQHEATDILAPRGTPVLAVEDGIIQKLFLSKPGGLTIYEFDLQGTFCYYYAHLDHYAPGVKDGTRVSRGEVIGYVGTTGNAPPQTPHLHFGIFRLGPEKHWWEGAAIDPYPVLMKSLK